MKGRSPVRIDRVRGFVRWLAIGAWACFCYLARTALAQPVEPEELSGIERPAEQATEPIRDVADALLWPLRLTLDVLFLTTGTAAGLIENEQLVPRVQDIFFTDDQRFGVFPTFFVETGGSPSIGARFIANLEPFAATLRAGYAGEDQYVAESRMRLSFRLHAPGVLSLEALHDRRTGLGFAGIGQTPETDGRNSFNGASRTGLFRERRERIIAGVGLRPLENVEALFSTSFTQRAIDDPADVASGSRLSDVFLSPLPGAQTTTRVIYTELALRLDTRANRSGRAFGALFEGYGGLGLRVLGSSGEFLRTGLQAAGFFPIIRRSSVISPKIVIDGVASGEGELPFIELVGTPAFRGFDTRRDNVSAVASLDYRWHLIRFVAARLFGDVARVYPSLSRLSVDELRWVVGLGFDLASSNSELGRVAVAVGPEGFNLLFTIGVPARFGDRQHRE
jgi:hypothetical protein